MAMLKHEETFREQVSELHRLYRIQKLLMESVGGSQQQQQKQNLDRYNMIDNSKKVFTIDHYKQQLLLQQAQAQRDISSTNINGKAKINSTILMGLNVVRPDNQVSAGSDARPSDAHERVADSNGNDKRLMLDDHEGDEIELTLSLGPSTHNPRRRKAGKSESGQSISSSSTGSSQTRKTSPKNISNNNRSSTKTWGGFPQGSGIEPGFSNGQQNSNPPWLYQALSLKLT